jgi:hypothetical protein
LSHYTKVKTKITNKELLVRALEDMGFKREQVEVHDKPVNLFGYQNDKRNDVAEVVLRRAAVGGASNDIGFKLQEDGTFGAIISEYDGGSNGACKKNDRTKNIRAYNSDWLKMLNQRYAYHHIKQQLADQNVYIESEREENGEVFIECSTAY